MKPNSHYGGNGYRHYSDDPDNKGRGAGLYRYFHGEYVKKENDPVPDGFQRGC